MSAHKKPEDGGDKLIATNPNAHRNYFLEEVVEAGLVLQGTEVKSIRAQSPNLKDAYVEVTSRRRASSKAAIAVNSAAPAGKKSDRKKGKGGPAPGGPGYALEAWIVNLHIGPYTHGNIWNHEPKRRRKLLLHSKQIQQMFGSLTQEGKTIIPTRMYFSKGRVKVEVAIAKGKKKGDKREDVKRRDQDREMDQALKKNRGQR